MTHNPYWNAYPVGGRPWNDDETKTLRTMLADGKTYTEIAGAVNRTYAAVKSRIHTISVSPEVRKAANRVKMSNRKIQTAPKGRTKIEERPLIPDYVIEDRNRRLLAARSLTGDLCGDPAPGFSALERRA